jgi:hypothetical protein
LADTPGSGSTFYVGAARQDDKSPAPKPAAYVKATYLRVNGAVMVDPYGGGSRRTNQYADDAGGGVAAPGTPGNNPGNYLIVPGDFSGTTMVDTAMRISAYDRQLDRMESDISRYEAQHDHGIGKYFALAIGSNERAEIAQQRASAALAKETEMVAAFSPGRPEDIQRSGKYGVPAGMMVPAFQDSASFYLGFVSALAGFSLSEAVGGGQASAWFHGHASLHNIVHWSFPDGLRPNDIINIREGFAKASLVRLTAP